ncbi:MAG TPA: TonB family protein [Candidatus Sulfotelmatobacter sp.]|nr:TonB family protein [Candidatus Sulfotelmatobacter sp.]
MSKPEEWKSWEGRVVEIFPLQQWLGGSDHSAVFLTEIPGASQRAAIKLVEAETGPDAEQQASRLRAAAKVSHPNLLRVFQAGQTTIDDTNVVYVVTECADDDLSQILPTRALESAEVSALLPPLLGALSHLHGNGLVHGRIKPSNVLAVGDRLKLSSDQIAPFANQNSHHRRRDAYDAPETAAGIVSPAGDIWSLGATLVAALTQKVSFGEDSQRDPGLPATLSEPYRTIARECLHLDPKKRWSLRQIETELKPETRSVPATAPSGADPVPARSGSRPAFPVTIATVVVLAVLFGFSYFRGNKSGARNAEPKLPATTSQPPTVAPAVSESPKIAKASTTKAGEVRHQVLPEVPQSAKNTITGTVKVTVRAQVDPSGKVTSAEFKSAGPSKYFAGLARTAAERWEFSPPETDGQPVTSTWLIQFRFKRNSTQASAQRVTR